MQILNYLNIFYLNIKKFSNLFKKNKTKNLDIDYLVIKVYINYNFIGYLIIIS